MFVTQCFTGWCDRCDSKKHKTLVYYACAHAREGAIVGLFHQVWIVPVLFSIPSCTQRMEFEVLDLFSLKSRTFSLKSALFSQKSGTFSQICALFFQRSGT